MSETTDQDILQTIRRFVEHDVIPVASDFEHRDEYPQALVDIMKQLGLFGATIPADYGGLGLSFGHLRAYHRGVVARMDEPVGRDQQPSDHGLYHRECRHRRAEGPLSAGHGCR